MIFIFFYKERTDGSELFRYTHTCTHNHAHEGSKNLSILIKQSN